MRPRPGDVLRVDGRASVQFAADRALLLRVISVSTRPTYDGWAWLTGYVLDASGRALCRREVFVRTAGLRPAAAAELGPETRLLTGQGRPCDPL